MESVSIAVEVPKNIKTQLARLCYGLPNVVWAEPEDLMIVIKHLGNLEGSQILDVREQLETLHFKPIEISLEGVDLMPSKGKRGFIRAPLKPTAELANLKKEIDAAIAPLKLVKDARAADQHVLLGYFEQMHPGKAAHYLEACAGFRSESFLAAELVLVATDPSARRLYYIKHARFALSQRTQDKS